MGKDLLIYGANGYTGELITRLAVERGLAPILAGRNEPAISELAEKHGLEHRVFSLDEREKLDAALQEGRNGPSLCRPVFINFEADGRSVLAEPKALHRHHRRDLGF
jgi:hypothetical protein